MGVEKPIKVAIVIPAYNEGSVIGSVVESLDKVFSKSEYSYQIIVVDDGSTDSTAQNARNSGAKVISHIINSGAGSATATGCVMTA